MRAYAAKAKATDARKVRAAQLPSNKGFFIFMACCATGAVAMIALLVAGEIKGARVAPDLSIRRRYSIKDRSQTILSSTRSSQSARRPKRGRSWHPPATSPSDFTRAGFSAMIGCPRASSTFRCLAAIVGTMCASCGEVAEPGGANASSRPLHICGCP
jgi:hypothetical protein